MNVDLDFSKLTKEQIDCMNYHAFDGYAGGLRGSKKIWALLVAKGFLMPVEKQSCDSLGTFKWVEYDMPIYVHMAWCKHLAGDDKP